MTNATADTMTAAAQALDYRALFNELQNWAVNDLFKLGTLVQIGIALALLFLGYLVGSRFSARLRAAYADSLNRDTYLANWLGAVVGVVWLLVAALFLEGGIVAAKALHYSGQSLKIVQTLCLAVAAIRLVSAWITNRFWATFTQVLAIILAFLSILGLYDKTMDILERIGMDFGSTYVSLLLLFKGVILLVVFIQLAVILTRTTERRLTKSTSLSPSVQLLLTKTVKFLFYGLAVILALKAVGFSLTGLAFLSGAIGVGIGFGLQKIFANLISGIILLVDKSIKPGDTIEVSSGGQSVYGKISSINLRCVSVVSRDNKEYLVPNENLIVNQVVNWTYSNKNVRLRMLVGVSYNSDLRLAIRLMEEAARTSPRVLDNPKPACRLKGFGADSVDIELRVWINDPENGVGLIRHQVLLAIWDAFQENNIEIPFPQRDLHVRSLDPDVAEALRGKDKNS